MDEEFPRRRHILSQHDVPDAKRDKQGLKSLALGRRNLHAWKTIHVSGMINEDTCRNSRKRRVIVRRTKFQSMTILISILFSPRYRYSKHFSSLNGRHNDISWGKKHFLSKKLKFITSLLSSLRRSLDKVEISLSFFLVCVEKRKKEKIYVIIDPWKQRLDKRGRSRIIG